MPVPAKMGLSSWKMTGTMIENPYIYIVLYIYNDTYNGMIIICYIHI